MAKPNSRKSALRLRAEADWVIPSQNRIKCLTRESRNKTLCLGCIHLLNTKEIYSYGSPVTAMTWCWLFDHRFYFHKWFYYVYRNRPSIATFGCPQCKAGTSGSSDVEGGWGLGEGGYLHGIGNPSDCPCWFQLLNLSFPPFSTRSLILFSNTPRTTLWSICYILLSIRFDRKQEQCEVMDLNLRALYPHWVLESSAYNTKDEIHEPVVGRL